jgi:Ankyrin repeat
MFSVSNYYSYNYCYFRCYSFDRLPIVSVLARNVPQFGHIALHDAACSGHAEVCKVLLDAGANLNIQNNVSIYVVKVVAVSLMLKMVLHL